MKRCPSCNRTYADETMSFCLADGSLLSAPYDPAKDEPPPTEIMPETRAAMPSTEPGKPAIPTITSLPGDFGFNREDHPPPPRNRSLLLWIVLGVAVVLVMVAGLAIVGVIKYTARGTNESTDLSNQGGVLAEANTPTPSPIPSSSAASSMNSPTPFTRSTPSPAIQAATPQATPASSPLRLQPAGPTASSAEYYNKIFSSREVDTKPRILSKPQPSYTEEARKNQITGTVVLKVVLTAGGEVTNIQVISGLPDGLSERAIVAARQMKFVPAMKEGHPASVYYQLEYNFNLY